jgi:hypothetical protein
MTKTDICLRCGIAGKTPDCYYEKCVSLAERQANLEKARSVKKLEDRLTHQKS